MTVYVSQLRRALGAEAIEIRAGGYAVTLDPGVQGERADRRHAALHRQLRLLK